MFNIIPPGTNVDFTGKRHLFLGISGLAMLCTFYLLFSKGLNFGIDFTGGAEVHLRVPHKWNISELRKNLMAGGLQGLRVQQIGDISVNEFMVTAKPLTGPVP